MSRKKLIYPKLIPEQRREARASERAVQRSLLGGVDGNARERIQANANSHLATETTCEKFFAKTLDAFVVATGLRVSRQVSVAFSPEVYFILDAFIHDAKVAVEVDGPEHNRPFNRVKDEWRDEILFHKKRIRVLRFTNREVLETPPEALLSKLIDLVARRASAKGRDMLARRLSPRRQPEVGGSAATADGPTVRAQAGQESMQLPHDSPR